MDQCTHMEESLPDCDDGEELIDTKFGGVRSMNHRLQPSKLCLQLLIWQCQYQNWSWRHNWEGYSRLSVECTPQSLVSISSSQSSLNAKPCCMCVNRSTQDLEIYSIISRPLNISYTRSIIGRAEVGCLSNSHIQVWCLSAPLHDLCLINFFPCVCIDLFKT